MMTQDWILFAAKAFTHRWGGCGSRHASSKCCLIFRTGYDFV